MVEKKSLVDNLNVHRGDLILLKTNPNSNNIKSTLVGYVVDYSSTKIILSNRNIEDNSGEIRDATKWLERYLGEKIAKLNLKNFESYKIIQ